MPEPLQYSQPLFLEERPVAAWLGRFGTIIAGCLILLIAAAVVFIAVLWQRAPKWSRGLMLFEVLLLATIFIALRQSRAVTVVETSQLQLRLSIAGITFWKRTIALCNVQSVERLDSYDFHSVLQFTGGQVRFMTGKTNVRLKMRGANMVVGSAQPDELLGCLKKAITQSASPEAR